jgi:hypothetical protein
MTKSIKYYPLNTKQLHILKLIHKFRFMTAPLLAQYKNLKSRHSMYMTLELLTQQEYLIKRIDRDVAFQSKGGRYYLARKSFKVLRDTQGYSKQSLHAMYKNNLVRESSVDIYIETIRFYLALRDSYPGTFHIFTRSELTDFSELPDPRPDLYLNSITASGDSSKEYLLYTFTDTQFFVFKKAFDAIIEHFDSDDWKEDVEDETDYPAVLIVCADSRLEQRVQQHIAAKLDNTGIDDLEMLTTSSKGLLNSNKANRTIWSDVLEPEVLVSL